MRRTCATCMYLRFSRETCAPGQVLTLPRVSLRGAQIGSLVKIVSTCFAACVHVSVMLTTHACLSNMCMEWCRFYTTPLKWKQELRMSYSLGSFLFCHRLFCFKTSTICQRAIELLKNSYPCQKKNENSRIVFSRFSSQAALKSSHPVRILAYCEFSFSVWTSAFADRMGTGYK